MSDLGDSIVKLSGPRAKVALRISQRYERKGWTHKSQSIGEAMSAGGREWHARTRDRLTSKEAISRRRMLSVFGLVAAATLAVPATVLTTTEAEAVVGRPLSPGSVAGVARRQNRRNYKKKRKK